MRLIYNKIFLEHDTGMHPENKKRLEVFGGLDETKIESGEPYLQIIHTKEHIREVKKACASGKSLDSDTITSKKTYDAAIYAVGASVMASRTGDFALVRPPGHHAYPDRSSGFCIFNNLAIAVQKLVNEGKKVLIFDFDSHLGDGTQKIFYSTDKVFYWSIHQYPAFPGRGWVNEVGSGKGKGFTLNVPLPPKTADDLFLLSIRKFIPLVKKFKADVVALSAGFDGYQEDLLLDLKLSYNSYYELGKIVRDNFSNYFATLEGGYNTKALPCCVYNFLDGVNGKKQRFKEEPTRTDPEVKKEWKNRIAQVEKNIRRFW